MEMFGIPVKEVDIDPFCYGVGTNMGDDVELIFRGEKVYAVFSAPHTVEPVFYIWHGFKVFGLKPKTLSELQTPP
jgi:hypothetical protein